VSSSPRRSSHGEPLCKAWETARVEQLPPTGTVSFLLTDIEMSTRLWDEHTDMMAVALAAS
jgi:class 3 adenylate cyclase